MAERAGDIELQAALPPPEQQQPQHEEAPQATTASSSNGGPPAPPEHEAAAESYPSGLKLTLITIGLVLSILLAALDSTIVATAIPSITDEFGSISNIAWYGSAYSITNTAFQSTWGKAYKYFQLKRTFLAAIAVFELGNVICATAPSSNVLVLGRVVAGLGGGGVMTGSFISIALTAKPQYRATYMGILGLTFGCSSVAGPLLGGALTDGPGWRWCFWASLPIGALAAAMVGFFFTQPASSLPARVPLIERIIQMDIGGGTLVTGALTCWVLAMHWAGILPWNSAPIIGSFVGFAGFALVFALNERFMGSKAMVQGHLLKKRAILINLGYIFFLAGLYFPLLYILPVQFQSINNDSASESGVRLIPLVLGISIFTMFSNAVLTFWRHYKPFLVAGAVAGTAGVAMMFAADGKVSVGAFTGYEILAAIGIGLSLQIPMIANQAAVSMEDLPAATSLSLFTENLGTSLFVAAAEAAFTTRLVTSLGFNVPGVDPMSVVNAGATQIRTMFPAAEIPGILLSYLDGCRISQSVPLACGVGASVVSLLSAGPASMRVLKARMHKPHAT